MTIAAITLRIILLLFSLASALTFIGIWAAMVAASRGSKILASGSTHRVLPFFPEDRALNPDPARHASALVRFDRPATALECAGQTLTSGRRNSLARWLSISPQFSRR